MNSTTLFTITMSFRYTFTQNLNLFFAHQGMSRYSLALKSGNTITSTTKKLWNQKQKLLSSSVDVDTALKAFKKLRNFSKL